MFVLHRQFDKAGSDCALWVQWDKSINSIPLFRMPLFFVCIPCVRACVLVFVCPCNKWGLPVESTVPKPRRPKSPQLHVDFLWRSLCCLSHVLDNFFFQFWLIFFSQQNPNWHKQQLWSTIWFGMTITLPLCFVQGSVVAAKSWHKH